MLKQALINASLIPNILYIDRYILFIEKCKEKTFNGPFERHHILPRSLGGKEQHNIIKLSPRHHYIAHVLLAKATESPKMIKALHKMIYSRSGDVNRKYKITSRVYAYLREKHAKIVSEYSKGTVTAKQLHTGEIKRIPKSLFDTYNGILYEAVSKGRKDSAETTELKRTASKRSRKVRQGLRSRSLAASKYSFQTPKGFCEISADLKNLYPSFTKNTLLIIDNDVIISAKFASIHKEFLVHIGKTFKEYGIIKLERS